MAKYCFVAFVDSISPICEVVLYDNHQVFLETSFINFVHNQRPVCRVESVPDVDSDWQDYIIVLCFLLYPSHSTLVFLF